MMHEFVVNQNIIEMEYAVRGAIPQRAAELKKQGRKTIPCNIGNPQALGQKAITFYRQVLSLLEDPYKIAKERKLKKCFLEHRGDCPADLKENDFICDYILDLAESILSRLEHGLGAYTESKGPLFIREAIAKYIDRRDGADHVRGQMSDPEMIFLTNGASEAAKYVLEMLIAGPQDGIMIPIPQYPLYSAVIRKLGGIQVNYYPDEERGWALDKSMLVESFQKAANRGTRIKAIVVINPGNPTGAILDEQSIREVIDFAEEKNLAIIADEVYQDNLYGQPFFSFARVLGNRNLPLFSLHSASKGFYGECGQRGGYLEVRNPPKIKNCRFGFLDILSKQASVALCSNTVGQVLCYLMVQPPEGGSIPNEHFLGERERILRDLNERALLIKESFRQMRGVSCPGRIGAMYLFPNLGPLPKGTTDFDYCMALLEETGLCTVNGSGFGQREGSHHLRIAFLPPRELLEQVLPRWIDFHHRFTSV